MSLSPTTLEGIPRLDQLATGAPSIKVGGPPGDADAVRAIQKALAALVGPMPRSFKNGPDKEPDGVFGSETQTRVIAFQRQAFPGDSREWDGRVGRKTLEELKKALARGAPAPGPSPAPTPPPISSFICGPDVTDQVVATWTAIQTDFGKLTAAHKKRACFKILLPFKRSEDDFSFPTSLEELKQELQRHADINGWDTLPLYQGASWWLRHPPIFDPALNGPLATPSSPNPDADDFDPSHEDEGNCANTVEIGGKCWLNGTANYGTFGIMVRLCSDFAAADWTLRFNPVARAVFSLSWAETLIRAYKRFGANPEGAKLPIAWTRATFNGGPRGVPTEPGNRPRCGCTGAKKGNVVNWDYVWEPHKSRGAAKNP